MNSQKVAQEELYKLPYHWFPEKYLKKFDRRERQKIIFHYIEKFLTNTPATYLDVGCGDGRWTTDIYNYLGKNVAAWGIDISERAIGFARLISPMIRFSVMSGDSTNFQSNYFDLITMIEVIEHMPDDREEKVIREVHRLLKGEGLLILTTPSLNERLNAHHFRHYSVESITDLLVKHNFSIMDIKGQGKPIYGPKKEIRKFMKELPLFWKTWRFSYKERNIGEASHLYIAARPI
jgi:ubiquinone/menaquinone biosynthesis C-methylase UbiE